MRHKLYLVLSFYIGFFTAFLPDAPLVMRFRGWLFCRLAKGTGKNFQVAQRVALRGLENLVIGDNVYIGPGTILLLRHGCQIGNNVLIGPNCVISDANHGFDGNSYRFARGKGGPIVIGDGAWLAANVVVTQSSNVPSKIVVGPNEVFRGDKIDETSRR